MSAKDLINKVHEVRAMLGLPVDDKRGIFRLSEAVNPRVLIDLHGNKWDIEHGCGWIAIQPRIARSYNNLLRLAAANLSDLVVFYRESDLAEWRKGNRNG